MKRNLSVLCLMSALLIACGGQETQGPIDEPAPSPTGTLRLEFFKDSAASSLRPQDVYADRTTNIRVRVTNISTGFSAAQDVVLNAGAQGAQFAVPVADGYKVEAVSYKYAGGELMKYGAASNLAVKAGATTDVDLVLTRPNIKITMPAEVMSGETINMKLEGVPEIFNDYGANVWLTATPATTNQFQAGAVWAPLGVGTAWASIKAPIVQSDTTVYANFGFNRDFYGTWAVEGQGTSGGPLYGTTMFLPDAPTGQAPLAVLVKPANGSIGIRIGY